MDYIIGIDSGGTKSELVAYDLDCNKIYTKIGGFGNPAVNLDKTINNIISLIDESIEELGKDNCKMISIGMAAVETGNYAQLVKNYVEKAFDIETAVLNDAEMACKAYFGNSDGILTIAGTGSSSFYQKHGKGEMVGGWSHILGDEGSGYHTVIEVFKHITQNIDNGIAQDALSTDLLRKIGGNSRSDIMNFIYNNEKNIIASLFPTIVEHSIKNDEFAILILEQAGKLLSDLTQTAYKKANYKKRIKIGIKGGVFFNSNIVFDTYKKELDKKIENYDFISEDISATKAVCNIFKKINK